MIAVLVLVGVAVLILVLVVLAARGVVPRNGIVAENAPAFTTVALVVPLIWAGFSANAAANRAS